MKAALRQAAHEVDVIHTNSLWMMPNVYPAASVAGTDCRLVISPRGTLSDWALSRVRWRKRLVGCWGQHHALHEAHCLHVTSEHELEECRRFGLKNPVAVIPNGIDCPVQLSRSPDDTKELNLLFLSRIHPTKGVDLLLRAWHRLEGEFPRWTLTIAGPDQHEFAEQMKSLMRRLGLRRVRFVGEVTGARKTAAFLQATLFVLPTQSENFGNAIGEALAHGVPVVVSRGAPWAAVHEERCGWWFELSEEILVLTLRQAMELPQADLAAMGQRGRQWIQRAFSWPAIGERMYRTYEWVCGQRDQPDWVRLVNE
jgi:glycosyltransferase involved in cell wall biosynthesis